MGDPRSVVQRHGKRIAVTVVGGAVVVAGVLLSLPLVPGPGLLIALAGLAILATEYEWARRLLVRARSFTRRTFDRARGRPAGDPAARPLDNDRDVAAG